ncbi:MAG: hypothetical protein ABI690_00915 [Chloroflexota bacterium]
MIPVLCGCFSLGSLKSVKMLKMGIGFDSRLSSITGFLNRIAVVVGGDGERSAVADFPLRVGGGRVGFLPLPTIPQMLLMLLMPIRTIRQYGRDGGICQFDMENGKWWRVYHR